MASAAEAIEAIADLESAEAELADTAVAVVEGTDGEEGVDMEEAMEMEKDIEQHMPDAPVPEDVASMSSAQAVMESSDTAEPSVTDTTAAAATTNNESSHMSEAVTPNPPDAAAVPANGDEADMAAFAEPATTSAITDAEPSIQSSTSEPPSNTPAAQLAAQDSTNDASEPAATYTAQITAPIVQSAPATPITAKTDAQAPLSMPAGVSEQSMTVRNNPDLIYAWRSGVFIIIHSSVFDE
jgi:hypothetical protein